MKFLQIKLLRMKVLFITFLCFILMTGSKADNRSFEFYEPFSRFQADRGALNRKYTLRETTEYYERMSLLYDEWLGYLDEKDFDALSVSGRVDYLLFRNYLERAKFLLELEEKEYMDVHFVTVFADDLYRFIRERRRGKNIDGRQIAGMFHKTALLFEEACEDLKERKPFDNWMVADKAAGVVRSLLQNLEESYEFYYGYHPDFSWWAEAPYKNLYEVLENYEKIVRGHYPEEFAGDDGSGIVGKPEGRESIIKRLQFELIPYTPEELIKIGRQELEMAREEMVIASREMGYGDDWRAALEYVKEQHVPAGEQPELINRLAEDAISFIEGNDMLTVPEMAKETWRMVMLSPEQQLVSPFFLGGEAIRISYPTNTMDHDAKMMSLRGNNPHFCKAVVHHELIAGHHMQGFMNQRYKPYRRMFGTPFWTEGWALYWEFILYDMGYPESPEDRIGFLFWRKHRAARIIFSIQYHLNEMTPQECINFLVDEVGHERANAEAEVRRSFTGRYDPLYQLAYMIGGIQFSALREEMVEGGEMTVKEFHDTVLKENNLPVELLRALLKRELLPQNFESSWRFADDLLNE